MKKNKARLEVLEQKNAVTLASAGHLAMLRFICFEYQEKHGQPMPPAEQQEVLNRIREDEQIIEQDILEGETPSQAALRRFAEANS